MALQTGENEQALRKILDMTRLISLVLLLLHVYYFCYATFERWEVTSTPSDRLLESVRDTGLFDTFHRSKVLALGFLLISLLGAKGRKQEKLSYRAGLSCFAGGLILYFGSCFFMLLPLPVGTAMTGYMVLVTAGYLLILSGGMLLARVIHLRFDNSDIFNRENETFPQEERLLNNEYSINLPARYRLKNRLRKSWINIINPFRGILVLGTPGAGKSYFFIRHVITQHIRKGFAMFVYDFKFDDLSLIAYNTWLRYGRHHLVPPAFYVINFDDLSRSHRCNPLAPGTMTDITDAAESARTILLGLNREWIRKQGDFFVESPINFLTAIIWFLRRYRDGEFCTLPHVIELMQADYERLFTVLRTEPEIEVLINPFVNAFQHDVMEQLEGQIASAKVALARLSSPQLYYVLSGNDFTLDLNNPEEPKIICMGNNPQKIQIYGAVLSLFVTRLVKLVNQKGRQKCSLVFDEFPTLYLNNMDSLIATARSNKVATCLGVQDFSQLRKDYGREQADVITGIVGNVVCGQAAGETARLLSDRFGRILQDRQSISVNSGDTSVSRSRQLEAAIPASRIANLSSGEFVGQVADDPACRIDLKVFHAEILNDHEALRREETAYESLPAVRTLSQEAVQRNYLQVKQDIQNLLHHEMDRVLQDPALAHLLVTKPGYPG